MSDKPFTAEANYGHAVYCLNGRPLDSDAVLAILNAARAAQREATLLRLRDAGD